MGSRPSSRAVRFLASSTLFLALVTGCSGGGGGKAAPSGLPAPAMGKVAAFDLSALSKKYDLNKTVVLMWSLVASDRAGNVYMLDWSLEHPDVMRMTPQGVVSRYVKVDFRVGAAGMVVRTDGSVVFGESPTSTGEFPVVNRDGTETVLKISPEYRNAQPIGERPDGSLIISEGGNIWSLKGGKATQLYHQSQPIDKYAVVDPSGTVYVVPENLGDILAIPIGTKPYHVHVSGKVPGTDTAITSLLPADLTPASAGGFYTLAENKANTEFSVVHVQGAKATVLAKLQIKRTCLPGKQYPALANTCGAQAYIVQSGDRVLLLGNLTIHNSTPAEPALALKAAS